MTNEERNNRITEINKIVWDEIWDWVSKTDTEDYKLTLHNWDEEMAFALLSWESEKGKPSCIFFWCDAGDMEPRQLYLDAEQTNSISRMFSLLFKKEGGRE